MFLPLRCQSFVISRFCCRSWIANLLMNSKYHISLPRNFFAQILKWVTEKAINDIPRGNEESSPGGARGHANHTGQGGSRKFQINREIRPTLQCLAGPAPLLRAACRAEGGLSAAFDSSPKRTHASHRTSTQLARLSASSAHCFFIKQDKTKASYMSWSKFF